MKPNQTSLSLECLAHDNKARGIGATPLFEYDSTGAKTSKQIGYVYECLLEKNGFEKISVKVPDITPLITSEQLAEAKEPIYLQFTDFVGKFYFSERTKTWELTCKATSAGIVKQK